MIRLLLQDNNIPYHETNTMDEDVFMKEMKPKAKFGQLPLLQDGDTQIPQSGAIMRHLARKHDLYGATIDENTRCDVIYDTKVDITNKIISIVQTKGDFESQKKEYVEKTLPPLLTNIEKFLKENDDGKGYFVGKTVTFADYGMYDVLVMVNAFDVGCLNKYSTLKAFVERMEARPNLKKYINSDEYKALVLSPSPRLQLQWTE